jgi:hypothetical protein
LATAIAPACGDDEEVETFFFQRRQERLQETELSKLSLNLRGLSGQKVVHLDLVWNRKRIEMPAT